MSPSRKANPTTWKASGLFWESRMNMNRDASVEHSGIPIFFNSGIIR